MARVAITFKAQKRATQIRARDRIIRASMTLDFKYSR